MKRSSEKQKTDGSNCRVSVTFDPEQYAHLVRMAEQKRVSLAWVVRDAVDKMLDGEMPLFVGTDRNGVENEARSIRG